MRFILTRNTLQIVGLTLALSAAIAAHARANEVAMSKGNGAYFSVSGTDTSGCIWSYVYVSKSGTAAAPQTWLYYDVYNLCQREWIAYGRGLVANTTFKVTGKKAALFITPSANASFVMEGVTGNIQLTLTSDGVYSSTYSGHSRTEYADHVYQSHGSWSSQSATVTGSVLGFSVDKMQGGFGEGRDKYMQIERGSK